MTRKTKKDTVRIENYGDLKKEVNKLDKKQLKYQVGVENEDTNEYNPIEKISDLNHGPTLEYAKGGWIDFKSKREINKIKKELEDKGDAYSIKYDTDGNRFGLKGGGRYRITTGEYLSTTYAKGGSVSSDLEVTSIKYQETRRGISYIAQTNKKGVKIVNDGFGGATFVEGVNAKNYRDLTEHNLERLIDDYESKNYAKGGKLSSDDKKSIDEFIEEDISMSDKYDDMGLDTPDYEEYATEITGQEIVDKSKKKDVLKYIKSTLGKRDEYMEDYAKGGKIGDDFKVGDNVIVRRKDGKRYKGKIEKLGYSDDPIPLPLTIRTSPTDTMVFGRMSGDIDVVSDDSYAKGGLTINGRMIMKRFDGIGGKTYNLIKDDREEKELIDKIKKKSDKYEEGGKVSDEKLIKDWEEWVKKSYGNVEESVEHWDSQGTLVSQIEYDLEIDRAKAHELSEKIYEKYSEGGKKFAKGGSIRRTNNSPLLRYTNFEDGWVFNLVKLDTFRNQDGLRYKGNNKYGISRSGPGKKQEVWQFETLKEANKKYDELVELGKTYSKIERQGEIKSNYAKGGKISYDDVKERVLDNYGYSVQDFHKGMMSRQEATQIMRETNELYLKLSKPQREDLGMLEYAKGGIVWKKNIGDDGWSSTMENEKVVL